MLQISTGFTANGNYYTVARDTTKPGMAVMRSGIQNVLIKHITREALKEEENHRRRVAELKRSAWWETNTGDHLFGFYDMALMERIRQRKREELIITHIKNPIY